MANINPADRVATWAVKIEMNMPDPNSTSKTQSPSQSTAWKFFALLAAVALLVTIWRPLDYFRARATDHEAVGMTLPDLTVESLTGRPGSRTSDDLTGRVTLINLWGPWCGICLVEFPHLVKLEQRFGDHDDFQLLAVAYPVSGDDLVSLRDDARDYLDRIGADLPTYADPSHATRMGIVMTTGIEGFPTTVLVDRQGTIRAVWAGYRRGDAEEMERLVAELLAE